MRNLIARMEMSTVGLMADKGLFAIERGSDFYSFASLAEYLNEVSQAVGILDSMTIARGGADKIQKFRIVKEVFQRQKGASIFRAEVGRRATSISRLCRVLASGRRISSKQKVQLVSFLETLSDFTIWAYDMLLAGRTDIFRDWPILPEYPSPERSFCAAPL